LHRLAELPSSSGLCLSSRPLIERKQLLWQLVEPGVGRIQFSEHFEGDALAIFRAVERLGLEGIVSKQADSRYWSDLPRPG
jgi:ATP-dependent DNA ligase